MRKAILFLFVLTFCATAFGQQEVVIESFSRNGQMVFNQVTNAVEYRVEWAPSADGPWTNFNHAGLMMDSIPADSSGPITAAVPMVYRVVAVVDNQTPPGTVLIPGGTNAGTDPDFGAYSLTVDSFYMGQYEVTNDQLVEVLNWAYGAGKLSVTASSVRNTQGNAQELVDLDDSNCRIQWTGSKFVMKSFKGSGYPAVEVTWYGAVAYCNFRSEMEGRTPCYDLSYWSCDFTQNEYRLPRAEEWEYAARGG